MTPASFRGLTDPRLAGALRRAKGGPARKKKKGVLSIIIVLPPPHPGALAAVRGR